MKTTDFKSKTVAVLATLVFLSIPVPTIAADFFPLDIWEEMDAWEHTLTAGLDPDIGVKNQTIPIGIDDAKMIKASFPLDVWEELDDLDYFNWRMMKNRNAFNIQYGTAKEDTKNPYWMPEEIRNP